jgi:peptidoglycan hydrolase-like protein with peptidoglycan-binding domain
VSDQYKQPRAVTPEELLASLPQPAGPHVQGTDPTDEVRLSAVVYQNPRSRRSLSVWHVQRRLNERGYDTGGETTGYFSDGTREALRVFQRQFDLPGDGLPTAESLTALFGFDPNVTLRTDL